MAPQSVARGAPQSGDRAAEGMPDRAKNCWVAYSPLRGRIFLSEETAPPFAVYSRRRLSRIPSREATVAPAETCSEVP
jgi:hypothetical protein